MAKQKAQQTTTEVDNTKGVGRHIEQSVTMDDCCLPNASELEAYKSVNVDIVPYLMEMARKEQEHRHSIEKSNVEILKENNDVVRANCEYSYKANTRGMTYAFLIIVLSSICSAVLIYFDKSLAGSIFGGTALLTAIAIFRPRSNNHKESDQKNKK
ncbi:MAG: DUF2335 domain-containing protein [Rikenellaceae bacterium]